MLGKVGPTTAAGGEPFDFRALGLEPKPVIYDHPGSYAQRFDGIDPGGTGGGDIEPVTDPAGNLWLCRTDEDGGYSECIPWP